MLAPPLPPRKFLVECFDYDPGTGHLIWRQRPSHHFELESTGKTWNARYAGQVAGSPKAGGYVSVQVRYGGVTRKIAAHRVVYLLATGVEVPELDHIDRNPSNNRISNLRPASRTENNANRAGKPRGVLPKGVYARNGKFIAAATIRGVTRHLGRYATPEEAHAAYVAAAAPAHGEFFCAGLPDMSVFG